ncbi:MAG: hypothetical protein LPK19_14900 [Hymenobacteraceae bacterium]|nr:hypothetical protein [Hymenobacteraceae bacterium]MDX5513600.1 hypothetical protein [Hymenobacteraceae bacterium]
MRVVILGASGQIGARLYAHLKQKQPAWEITGTTRKPNQNNLLIFDPFSENWQKLGRADVLINCIGIIEPTTQTSFHKIHVQLTQLMLQNRILLGSPRIIQFSALGAAATHASAFLKTKGLADQLLLEHPNTVILRPSIVCTPNTMLVRKLRILLNISRFTFGFILLPKQIAATKLQPVLVNDLLEIATTLINSSLPENKIIEVAGKEIYSLKSLLNLVPAVNVRTFPQKIFDAFSDVLPTLFPKLISKEQLLLLQFDNIGNVKQSEEILQRNMRSTRNFWINELTKKE